MGTDLVVITVVGLAGLGVCVLLVLAVKALASLMDPHKWD